MKKRIVWLAVSCLIVAALVLVSCAPAVTEEEEAVTEEEAPSATEETPTSTGTTETRSADEIVRNAINDRYEVGDPIVVSGVVKSVAFIPLDSYEHKARREIEILRTMRKMMEADDVWGWYIKLKLGPDLKEFTLMCYFEDIAEINKLENIEIGQNVAIEGEFYSPYYPKYVIIGNCFVLKMR